MSVEIRPDPLEPVRESVCATIRGAAPGIAEAVKWNAPSFLVKETGQFFATVNIHGKSRPVVLVVFHQGAKVTRAAKSGVAIEDPSGLLEWPAKDRCVVRFESLDDAKRKRTALREIVRQWVAAL
jgi:hypothetical protein